MTDRTAQEREDHILDCYETIKQQDAEIERLHAERDKLVAALRSADCPAGGFNGMPKDAAATVGTCLQRNVCDCWFGAAIAFAQGQR